MPCAYRLLNVSILLIVASLCGCANYTAPGRAADLRELSTDRIAQTEGGVAEAMLKKPLASFPTGIAMARVQAKGYSSPDQVQTVGGTMFCVVLTRNIEGDAQIEKLQKMPMVAGLCPMNRLLLPGQLNSDSDLRNAAAQLHADMLLIYTLDTTFYDEDLAEALSIVTLGVSPNHHISVTTTASAILMDTRNGYLYGAAEATSRHNELANAWGSTAAIDRSRRENETEAFDKLVGELQKTWTGVVTQYATPGPVMPKNPA